MSKRPIRRNNGYAGSAASSGTGSQSNASAYSTPATPLTPDQSEHRKRQTKRDEQIRKKLENEISKEETTTLHPIVLPPLPIMPNLNADHLLELFYHYDLHRP